MRKTSEIILLFMLSIAGAAAQEVVQTDTSSIFSVVEVLDEAVMTAEKNRVVYRLDRQKLSGAA